MGQRKNIPWEVDGVSAFRLASSNKLCVRVCVEGVVYTRTVTRAQEVQFSFRDVRRALLAAFHNEISDGTAKGERRWALIQPTLKRFLTGGDLAALQGRFSPLFSQLIESEPSTPTPETLE